MSTSALICRKELIALLCFLLVALSGCSEFMNSLWGPSSQPAQEKPKAETPVPTPTPVQGKNIELLWQVPHEAVDAYHVYLLNSAGEEKRHYRIPVWKLEKRDDATYGPVYRYVLPDSAKGEAVTISIRAENRFGLSEPSEPMIVGQ